MPNATDKILGTHIDPPAVSPHGCVQWAQHECRYGSLRGYLDDYINKSKEPVLVSNTVVESITKDGITCVIPSRVFDHESASAFSYDLRLTLNPSTGEVVRL